MQTLSLTMVTARLQNKYKYNWLWLINGAEQSTPFIMSACNEKVAQSVESLIECP